MATRTMVADQPIESGAAESSAYALPHPVVLGAISGAILWLSFPPAEWCWSAWIALVPLFLLVVSRRSAWSIYLGAWVGGLGFWLLAIKWIWATDQSAWLGWVVMALFLSLWWPVFVFLARFAKRRLGIPLIVAAPVFWVALEYLRAHILTGFPWYYLAHSQYRLVYLTQIADFSSALGLSFLIALVNAYLVDLLSEPLFRQRVQGSWWVRLRLGQRVRLVTVSLALVGTVAYGVFRVESASFSPGPRIAMLQTNDIIEFDSDQKRGGEAIQADLDALIDRAKRANPKPDLIVWPETANPWSYYRIDPKLDRKTLDALVKQEVDPEDSAERWLANRDAVDAHFSRMIDAVGIPMMVGTSIYEAKPSSYLKFNAAILFRPGLPIQYYHKLHLVPFGEYVPLLKQLPGLIWLTPYRGTRPHFLDHGQELRWFDLGRYRLAAAICFEDTVPHVVRRFFAEAPEGRQPDVVVNLSNDGWFKATEEHEMHLAVSVFRCIENRVPLARSVNTGISAMIDGNGRIIKSMEKLKKGVLIEVAPLDPRVSLYSQWGDWLGMFCGASTLGLLLMGTFSPRKLKSNLMSSAVKS
jgi:apolipoprotein N-acyltransferase